MKNILTPVFFVALLFLLTASECKKPKQIIPDNPYGLPNATQTGAGIFACRVNGQNFIAYNDTLIVGGQPKRSYVETIMFQITTNLSQGNIYNINNNTAASSISDFLCSGPVTIIYQFSAIKGVVQIIKLDKSSIIASVKHIFYATFNLNH